VRINDTESPEHTADLQLIAESGLPAVMLPKAETIEQVAAVRAAAGPLRVLALIETARGVEQAGAVAAADGVARLVFGTLDLALDLDLDIEQAPDGLGYAAGRLAVASRIAGLPAPVAGVTPQLGDQARLLADLAWSRRHGFGAKLCIHPAQVEPIHTALAPDAEALAWAHRVLAADRAAPGAARLDGRMIDRPVVLQAARTLARAGH
jgi:citrate lyase subunit beta/citryl-CoA lyase